MIPNIARAVTQLLPYLACYAMLHFATFLIFSNLYFSKQM